MLQGLFQFLFHLWQNSSRPISLLFTLLQGALFFNFKKTINLVFHFINKNINQCRSITWFTKETICWKSCTNSTTLISPSLDSKTWGLTWQMRMATSPPIYFAKDPTAERVIPDPRRRKDFSCYLSAAEEKGLPKGLHFLDKNEIMIIENVLIVMQLCIMYKV